MIYFTTKFIAMAFEEEIFKFKIQDKVHVHTLNFAETT